ncbi:39S ribosomal protein L52, mitochondrial [Diorhabda carinulata]|uniref:39S ribosomal protein L52, mitochondrial n=1 Tax=Diorhabda carinulata TaxID=1163345 RepID=UPI0025A163BE|nr:39S ribosomal protein L52, mitochondrial [Diorhabda carinulata]
MFLQINIMQNLRLVLHTRIVKQSRCLNTSSISYFNQKWRKERGLPLNPNACGVLTDAPDYTFLDGRLTPYGEGQKERIKKQQQIKQDIIRFTDEIDFAVDRYNNLLQAEEDRKKAILDRKLKPKGINLLKKHTTS